MLCLPWQIAPLQQLRASDRSRIYGEARGVVFAHRAPLALRQVGPPPLLVPLTTTILGQAD